MCVLNVEVEQLTKWTEGTEEVPGIMLRRKRFFKF